MQGEGVEQGRRAENGVRRVESDAKRRVFVPFATPLIKIPHKQSENVLKNTQVNKWVLKS